MTANVVNLFIDFWPTNFVCHYDPEDLDGFLTAVEDVSMRHGRANVYVEGKGQRALLYNGKNAFFCVPQEDGTTRMYV